MHEKISIRRQLQGVFLLTSTIIGAGIFGIPFIIAKVGLLIGLSTMVLVWVAVTYIHLCIAEVTLRTRGHSQLPGLAVKYLGRFGGIIYGILFLFLSFLALTAYLIGGGEILYALTSFWSSTIWGVILWCIGFVVVFIGLKGIRVGAAYLAPLLFGLVIIFVFVSAPHIELNNFKIFGESNFFFPFGVFLFAFGGMSVIPELELLFPHGGRVIERVIFIGSFLPLITYIVFSLVVVGVTGIETTPVATIGLIDRIGVIAGVLGGIVTVIAMGTSLLMHGLGARRVFEWDMCFSRGFATFLAMGIPLLLFLFGAKDFIQTIGIAGALGIGIEGILAVLIFWRAKQNNDFSANGLIVKFPYVIGIFVLLIFVIGAASLMI